MTVQDDLADIPVAPLADVVTDVIDDMGKFGPMPGYPLSFPEMHAGLADKIRETNGEILVAKNRDDVAAAQARLAFLQEEHARFVAAARSVAVEGLLQTIYICLGHFNGRRVVIPAGEWVGDIDWDQGTLQMDNRVYRQIRCVASGEMPQERVEALRRRATATTPVSAHDDRQPESPREAAPMPTTGTPGRPEKHISLVVAEFERRAKAGRIEASLAQQSRVLEAWFKASHPDKQAPTAKTIENRLRAQYREALSRLA